MRLILFLIQTLWKPGQSMLAPALETMSLREIGPQWKFPSVGGLGISTSAQIFSSASCVNHARNN